MAVFKKQGPKQDWPAWRVGPDGQRQLFQKPEDVPEGWVSRRAEAVKAALVDDEGNPAPSQTLRPRRAQWPAWRVSPDGQESKIFHSPESVPPGWYSRREGPPKVVEVEPVLRTDGPTLEEYVEAGYLADNYPPQGYAPVTADSEAHTETRRTPLKLKRKVPNDDSVGTDSERLS